MTSLKETRRISRIMTRKSRSSRIGVVAIGLMLTLTACTDTGPVPDPMPSATDVATPRPHPTSTIAPDALDDGVRVAEEAMATFADHDRSYDDWWAALSPMLTNDALVAYEGTDPANVRPSQVTGPGEVASATNFNQMSVLVPTDVGQYTIDLIRQGDNNTNGTPSWFVDRLSPPAELG